MSQRIPIIKIRENLIVTFISDIDDLAALRLQKELTEMIHEENISGVNVTGVLLDLTILDMVDSFLGRLLSNIAQSAATMNANTVVVGIQPAVAITLVEMGLQLKGAYTALNVDHAFEILDDLKAESEEIVE